MLAAARRPLSFPRTLAIVIAIIATTMGTAAMPTVIVLLTIMDGRRIDLRDDDDRDSVALGRRPVLPIASPTSRGLAPVGACCLVALSPTADTSMTAVGFEPTQLSLMEFESTPLDHSGKLSLRPSAWADVISTRSQVLL
jgi:hypothetical protein